MDQPQRREPLQQVYAQLAEAIKILQEAREDVVIGERGEARGAAEAADEPRHD